MVQFEDTPLELRGLAGKVAREFERTSFRMFAERALSDHAPFRTTLMGQKGKERILFEVQTQLRFGTALRDLVVWLRQELEYASLYLATSSEAGIPGSLLRELKRHGVGLLLVDEDGTIQTVQQGQIFALLVPLTPTAPLSQLKKTICKLCERFNDGDRKDALRDLFELVERETDRLAVKAGQKGWVRPSVKVLAKADWSTKIDILGSAAQATGARSPLLESQLKIDLHSFRGARNLFDHPVRGVRAENRRELQFHERMIQGPRLLSELLRLQRKVR